MEGGERKPNTIVQISRQTFHGCKGLLGPTAQGVEGHSPPVAGCKAKGRGRGQHDKGAPPKEPPGQIIGIQAHYHQQ